MKKYNSTRYNSNNYMRLYHYIYDLEGSEQGVLYLFEVGNDNIIFSQPRVLL